jgi:hypothetical protein
VSQDFDCSCAESNEGVAKKDLAFVPICFAGLIYRLECGAREDQNTKRQNGRDSFLSFNIICGFTLSPLLRRTADDRG